MYQYGEHLERSAQSPGCTCHHDPSVESVTKVQRRSYEFVRALLLAVVAGCSCLPKFPISCRVRLVVQMREETKSKQIEYGSFTIITERTHRAASTVDHEATKLWTCMPTTDRFRDPAAPALSHPTDRHELSCGRRPAVQTFGATNSSGSTPLHSIHNTCRQIRQDSMVARGGGQRRAC